MIMCLEDVVPEIERSLETILHNHLLARALNRERQSFHPRFVRA